MAYHNSDFGEKFAMYRAQIAELFYEIYSSNQEANNYFEAVINTLAKADESRPIALKSRDKLKGNHWFLSNELVGMSLYVDRFCETLKNFENKLNYLQDLGINLLHLMPIMKSPSNESDGGYAVSDFKKIDKRFGTIADLQNLQHKMQNRNMYLMLDIVFNHTSHIHEWALKAKSGEKYYQDYYYCFDDRFIPDQFEQTMQEIFPESSPGNFTYIPEMQKWVMTVFHNYQWDLNYTNPQVFIEMLNIVLYYANLGVDILRIDAPAFIWKQIGTNSQNLPKAHTLLRLLKLCIQIAAPGMALLAEAIVAPHEIMKYFGEGNYYAKECDIAYNATQMALQWDSLATADTRILRAAQHEIDKKPLGTTWINYTRCHDDIGLGYNDATISAVGFNPFEHRKYIKDFYSGKHEYSTASGALFSVNPKTNDARISGTLASLCGLETAMNYNDEQMINTSLSRISMMQATSIFLGGIPMLFYGDEVAYTNDYSYLNDTSKSYDNRWMHRPNIDWNKNNKSSVKNTIENNIFETIQKILAIRKENSAFSDMNNTKWLNPHNIHVAGYIRYNDTQKICCLFNYSNAGAFLTWYALKEFLPSIQTFRNLWNNKIYNVGADNEYLILQPYEFMVLEAI